MTWLKTFLFVCLLLVFVFAALAVNQQQVALSFALADPVHPEYFLVAADVAAAWYFLGWSYSWVRHFPLRMQLRKLKKSLAAEERSRRTAESTALIS